MKKGTLTIPGGPSEMELLNLIQAKDATNQMARFIFFLIFNIFAPVIKLCDVSV